MNIVMKSLFTITIGSNSSIYSNNEDFRIICSLLVSNKHVIIIQKANNNSSQGHPQHFIKGNN